MRINHQRILCALALAPVLLLGSVSALRAQNGAWTSSASANWSATANWLGGVAANGAGNTAYFTNTYSAVPTITLDTARSIGNLTFGNVSGYLGNNVTISGSQKLTLDNSGNTPVITCWPLKSAGNSACAIICPLSGTLGLTKLGTGSLWLEANNQSLSGPLTIAQGRVFCYANGNALANVSSVVISNGCYLDFYNISVNLSATNYILNGMGATQDGQLKSTLQADGTATGSAGSFTINGTVTLNATSDIGGTSPAQTMTLAGTVTGPGGLVKDGSSGTLVLGNTNTYAGGTTVSSGLVKAQVAGSLGSGVVVVTNGAVLELDNPAAMSSSASLFVLGTTNLVNLNYSGAQIVNTLYTNGAFCAAGVWGAIGSSAANQSAAFSGSGVLSVSAVPGPSSGAWNVDASGNWSNPLNWLNTTVATGAGNTAYFTNSFSALRTITLDTARTNGSLTFGNASGYLGNNVTIGGSPILTLDNAGNAPVITCWPLLAAGNSACTITCPLSGSLGLVKQGTGTLWLNGNNLGLNGALVIAQGRVFNNIASGYGLGNMDVVISNGCYLSFWQGGTFPQNFTLNGLGGTVDTQQQSALMASSGTAQGNFTINGTLTLNATSDIGGSYSNQLMVLNGRVTGPGGLVKNGKSPSGSVGPGTLVLTNGANNYAGGTWVNGGVLKAQTAGSLGSGDVTVTNGAMLELDNPAAMSSSANVFLLGTTNLVNLNYSGAQTVNALYFNSASMARGTWAASGALHNHAAFTGGGVLNVTAGGATPSISIPAISPSPVCAGTTVSLVATVSDGSSPSGSVQFFDGVTSLGTAALVSGTATLNNVTLSVGAHSSITAEYLGDDYNNQVASAASSVTVNALPSTSAITGANSVCAGAAGVACSVTGTSGSSYGWTVPSGATITAGGAGPGNNSITVTFGVTSGNVTVTETNSSGCVGTRQTLAVAVNPLPAITTQTTNQTACAGSQVTWLVIASGTGLGYQWQRDGTNLVEGLGNFTGTQTPTLTNRAVTLLDAQDTNVLGQGYACVITNSSACSVNSTLAALKVNQASTTNSVTAPPNPSLPGSNVTFTATLGAVSPCGGIPTGTVQFQTAAGPLGAPVALDDNGIATLITNSLPHGSNTVTAEYAGNAGFEGSTNSVVRVVNTPPVGKDISLGSLSGEPAPVQIIGGKQAPTDADGDPMTVTATGPSANGIVTTDGTNVTYTSVNTFAGTDTFPYTVSDNYGGSCTNTITVIVSANGAGFNLLSGPVNNGDGTATIKFVAIPGYQYALESTPSLTLPISWTPVITNTAGTNGQLSFIFNTSAGQAYFQTRYVP